jgi:AcrR family transcriptional regulator
MAVTGRPSRSLRAESVRARRGGGDGFARRDVAQIQRARILAAMFEVASEFGAASVSVAHVVERSGVSRRTFYETFGDREDCFLAAFEDALAFASQRVVPAYQAEGEWREGVRAGLVAFLSFLDEEPVVGRLLIVESLSCGAKVLERRERVLARLAAAIDEGRTLKGTGERSASAEGLSALTAEGLVGGVLSLVCARIARGGEPLVGLANQLLSMIVLPYLGPVAARKELGRPVEPCANGRRDARLLEDPFKGAGMRLTYRTVRVLLVVAELGGREPGPSNRVIGEGAGIADQGQISKLLGRLARLGLIENTGLGPSQGAANAWTLTVKGRQLTKSIQAHTESPE